MAVEALKLGKEGGLWEIAVNNPHRIIGIHGATRVFPVSMMAFICRRPKRTPPRFPPCGRSKRAKKISPQRTKKQKKKPSFLLFRKGPKNQKHPLLS
jgi:hypothetical protein